MEASGYKTIDEVVEETASTEEVRKNSETAAQEIENLKKLLSSFEEDSESSPYNIDNIEIDPNAENLMKDPISNKDVSLEPLIEKYKDEKSQSSNNVENKSFDCISEVIKDKTTIGIKVKDINSLKSPEIAASSIDPEVIKPVSPLNETEAGSYEPCVGVSSEPIPNSISDKEQWCIVNCETYHSGDIMGDASQHCEETLGDPESQESIGPPNDFLSDATDDALMEIDIKPDPFLLESHNMEGTPASDSSRYFEDSLHPKITFSFKVGKQKLFSKDQLEAAMHRWKHKPFKCISMKSVSSLYGKVPSIMVKKLDGNEKKSRKNKLKQSSSSKSKPKKRITNVVNEEPFQHSKKSKRKDSNSNEHPVKKRIKKKKKLDFHVEPLQKPSGNLPLNSSHEGNLSSSSIEPDFLGFEDEGSSNLKILTNTFDNESDDNLDISSCIAALESSLSNSQDSQINGIAVQENSSKDNLSETVRKDEYLKISSPSPKQPVVSNISPSKIEKSVPLKKCVIRLNDLVHDSVYKELVKTQYHLIKLSKDKKTSQSLPDFKSIKLSTCDNTSETKAKKHHKKKKKKSKDGEKRKHSKPNSSHKSKHTYNEYAKLAKKSDSVKVEETDIVSLEHKVSTTSHPKIPTNELRHSTQSGFSKTSSRPDSEPKLSANEKSCLTDLQITNMKSDAARISSNLKYEKPIKPSNKSESTFSYRAEGYLKWESRNASKKEDQKNTKDHSTEEAVESKLPSYGTSIKTSFRIPKKKVASNSKSPVKAESLLSRRTEKQELTYGRSSKPLEYGSKQRSRWTDNFRSDNQETLNNRPVHEVPPFLVDGKVINSRSLNKSIPISPMASQAVPVNRTFPKESIPPDPPKDVGSVLHQIDKENFSNETVEEMDFNCGNHSSHSSPYSGSQDAKNSGVDEIAVKQKLESKGTRDFDTKKHQADVYEQTKRLLYQHVKVLDKQKRYSLYLEYKQKYISSRMSLSQEPGSVHSNPTKKEKYENFSLHRRLYNDLKYFISKLRSNPDKKSSGSDRNFTKADGLDSTSSSIHSRDPKQEDSSCSADFIPYSPSAPVYEPDDDEKEKSIEESQTIKKKEQSDDFEPYSPSASVFELDDDENSSSEPEIEGTCDKSVPYSPSAPTYEADDRQNLTGIAGDADIGGESRNHEDEPEPYSPGSEYSDMDYSALKYTNPEAVPPLELSNPQNRAPLELLEDINFMGQFGIEESEFSKDYGKVGVRPFPATISYPEEKRSMLDDSDKTFEFPLHSYEEDQQETVCRPSMLEALAEFDMAEKEPEELDTTSVLGNFQHEHFSEIADLSSSKLQELFMDAVPYYKQKPLGQAITDKYQDIPLAGLQYVLEVQKDASDLEKCSYICTLCSKKMIPDTLLAHVKSVPHRLKFVEIHHKHLHEEYGKLELKQWTAQLVKNFTNSLMEMEKCHGRRCMAVVEEKEVINAISYMKSQILLVESSRVQEVTPKKPEPSSAPSMMEALEQESSLENKGSGSRHSQSKSPTNQKSKPMSLKENYMNALKNGANLRAPGQNLQESSSRPSESSKRSFRSRSPTSGRSRSPVPRRPIHRRSRSPGSKFRRSRSPGFRGLNHSSRSRSPRRPSSTRFSRSPGPPSSKRLRRSRSPRRFSRSPGRLYRRKSRSPHSRTRSPSPFSRSMKRGRRDSRSPEFRRTPKSFSRSPSRQSVSTPLLDGPRKSEYMAQKAQLEHAYKKQLDEFLKVPESHPFYQVEWSMYWEQESKKLSSLGLDPSRHDFKDGWTVFWRDRLIALCKEEHDAKLKTLNLRYSDSMTRQKDFRPPVSSTSPMTSRDMQITNSGGNISGTKTMSEKSDPEFSVMGTLRLLRKLDDQLGSLGNSVAVLLTESDKSLVYGNNPINMFKEKDNKVLLRLCKDKLSSLVLSGVLGVMSVSETCRAIEACDWLQQEIDKTFADGQLTIAGLDIEKIANETLGMNTVEIAGCIAQQLMVNGRSDAGEKELQSILMAISATHTKMTAQASSIAKEITRMGVVPSDEASVKAESTGNSRGLFPSAATESPTKEKDVDSKNEPQGLDMLKSAYDEEPVSMDSLSMDELLEMLIKFTTLPPETQQDLTAFLKKLEATDSKKVTKLRTLMQQKNPRKLQTRKKSSSVSSSGKSTDVTPNRGQNPTTSTSQASELGSTNKFFNRGKPV